MIGVWGLRGFCFAGERLHSNTVNVRDREAIVNLTTQKICWNRRKTPLKRDVNNFGEG